MRGKPSQPSFRTVTGRRDKLISAARDAGWPGATLRQLVDAWARVLPGLSYAALHRSAAWVDAERTDNKLSEFCWAVAGNAGLLKDDKSVFPFAWPIEPTTVPVLIGRPQIVPGKPGKDPRSICFLTVVAGPGCPGKVRQSWSRKALQMVAHHPERGLGFERADPSLRFANAGQFAFLRAYATVSIASGEPKATSVWASPSMRTYNQTLTRMRLRVGFTCPFKYAHPCHSCPEGLSTCPAATHPNRWEGGDCPNCGARKWIEDGVCTSCQKPVPTGAIPS